ncbi:TPA: polysaccharide deacetylase family protein [Campylobacter jejuni]|nr:polysaccharide deacetylase family protein [Campylobacter jejuni]HDZ5089902.1 polysaccharide deacetylase family protein [Campylobacter jejuni]HDZ5091560.1 polysaccharide deacetylase family protein [Campylobacter jejuni]HDZ5100579.1 polysaccharide deacetylase family protein [Campylobacter jejuni]HDZ5106336.1 polysaccharide deacetylase family protein [Campylobacter jejuni]
MKIMHENGMILGSHSVNHCVFSKLANEEQEKEIHDSFNFLEKTIGKLHTKIFCYPYGGFHTFTDFTQKILKDSNCNFSFNVESRDITPNDLIKQPQALPRYDCNEFSFGQSNLG